MRGAPAWIPLHLWLAAIFAGLALVAAWRQRARRVAAATLAVLTMSQLARGLYLATSPDSRALAPGWLHAMIACALAVLLASLAFGGGHRR
jgi:peptidoglycan/LPS O-acetylase OafA/YrhL